MVIVSVSFGPGACTGQVFTTVTEKPKDRSVHFGSHFEGVVHLHLNLKSSSSQNALNGAKIINTSIKSLSL